MKTLQFYEASDIDPKDPVHGWLMTTILVSMLSRPEKGAEPLEWIKGQIAVHLNSATKAGISIVPTDTSIPAVFRDAG